MISLTDNLVLMVSPVQLVLVGLVAVLLLAPGLLPVIGRVLGRLVGFEMRRRYGVDLRSSRTGPAPAKPVERRQEVEILPPEHIQPTLRSGADKPLAPSTKPPAKRRSAPIWLTAAVVAGTVAVLSWLLLHAR